MTATLPAYGKALLAARRAGRHPAGIRVFWGRDWRDSTPWLESPPQSLAFAWRPRLAVDPEKYAPDTLDLRLLAGCEVVIYDRETLPRRVLDNAEALAWFVGEAARWALRVDILTGPHFQTAEAWAYSERRWDAGRRAMVWPAWWPEAVHERRAAA